MERALQVGTDPFVYMVQRGATIGMIARDLEAAGLLESALRLELQARWSGAASRIKAGEYAFEPGLTPIGLLDRLVAGTVVQHPFTIVEGWTFRDLRNRIAESGTLVRTLDGLSGEEVMRRLGLEGLHPRRAFLPRHLPLPPRRHGHAASASRVRRDVRLPRIGLGAAGSGSPALVTGRGAGARVHRREGDRRRGGAGADRRRIRLPAAPGHEAGDRSDGDLRPRGRLRTAT